MKILRPLMIGHKLSAAELRQMGQWPVDGWGLEMPVGSEIASVSADANGNIGAFALCAPNGVRVWHPMIVLPVGKGFEPVLGRSLGPCFGVHALGQIGLVAVYADLPWPSMLQVVN